MAHVALNGSDEVEDRIAVRRGPSRGTQPLTGIGAEIWLKVSVGGEKSFSRPLRS